jgi:putative ABC transport system ATP-binding protein
VDEVVRLTEVSKIYLQGDQQVHALKDVSLTVGRGEFVAIMGPSGSGKSTCLHILGCLDTPTSGEYLLEGASIAILSKNELAEIRNRRLGFVFQGFNLLARTTAIENVELPMIYGKVSSSARRKKALTALAMVGLADRAYHFNNQLSGGEQQRVAIARALVNDPALILADEPTGNLDSKTSDEIMGIFRELNDKGITLILVTHDSDVADYARRVVTFLDGRIITDTCSIGQRRIQKEQR